MAIIFADIFPEINKVYDHMQAMNKNVLIFGQTKYYFSTPLDQTRHTLQLRTEKNYGPRWARFKTSNLMYEYGEICKNFTESSQLSRHNKAIVKAVYKNLYTKFGGIIDVAQSNTDKLTKIESDLTKLKTQIEMLKGLKNIEKTCPRYIKVCGVVIPLNKEPETPFTKWLKTLDDANYALRECKNRIGTASNTRKKNALDDTLNRFCAKATETINSVKAEVEPFFKKSIPWVEREYGWAKAELGAMNPIKSNAFSFEPDKILGTGNAIHNILTTNGKICDSSEQFYWARTFLVNDLNGVLVMNGINTNQTAPMPSEVELDKVGKISRIFGIVKTIEQKIAFEETKKDRNEVYNLTEILDKIKTKLREIGIDPDVSVL